MGLLPHTPRGRPAVQTRAPPRQIVPHERAHASQRRDEVGNCVGRGGVKPDDIEHARVIRVGNREARRRHADHHEFGGMPVRSRYCHSASTGCTSLAQVSLSGVDDERIRPQPQRGGASPTASAVRSRSRRTVLCGIAPARSRRFLKCRRIYLDPLTNRVAMWYNIGAVGETRRHSPSVEEKSLPLGASCSHARRCCASSSRQAREG
jgi:hypothetical protein